MSSTREMIVFLILPYLADLVLGHRNDIPQWYEKINSDVTNYNRIASEISWESSVHPGNPELAERAAKYQKKRLTWQHRTCDKLAALQNGHFLNGTQRRQTYLLCRGPIYTFDEATETSALYEELESTYSNAEVCLPTNKIISKENLTEVEGAILEYIESVKLYLNSEHKENDPVEVAAKLTASDKNDKNVLCLKEEADFEKPMSFSRHEEVLRWVWLVWRETVGPTMKEPYKRLVGIENIACRRNGYTDIGAAWRDELETPGLRRYCRHLYDSIRPLYNLLHGVARFYLRKQYGGIVPEKGPIPAHLLGNLWSQNWEPLADLIAPSDLNIDKSIMKMNWTVTHMVKRAEDFYQSLGLPPMTEAFWRESVFAKANDGATRCHGTAADMFSHADYRLLYCAGTSSEDFYVIHHEMGHIQYYMAYEYQPGIFRQGANSAFHESIGDAIMYGVTTPQHLYRLGLINDSLLYSASLSNNLDIIDNEIDSNQKSVDKIFKKRNEIYEIKDSIEGDTVLKDNADIKFSPDDILLLKQALNKIPQIPFSLLIDEYRWKFFGGRIKEDSYNKEFWNMALELQGIAPPGERGEEYFDIAAKFHVPDNTPYIRLFHSECYKDSSDTTHFEIGLGIKRSYGGIKTKTHMNPENNTLLFWGQSCKKYCTSYGYFLSSFLQHQLFEALCKAAVFGRRDIKENIPDSITLNRCDIYGSKAVGKLLRDIMSRGSSQHWREVLLATIGTDDISASPLKRYYRPLYKLLSRVVRAHRIPIGWE